MIHRTSFKTPAYCRLFCELALSLCVLVTGTCSSVAAQENSVNTLYQSGVNATAVLLNGKAKVPGSRFPCANCHGDDGMGSREGATRMPPVSWRYLSQPTPERPAYTGESFKKAITQGISASGQKLGELMPRYETSSENLDKLIGYLKKLDSDQRTGITTRSIQIVPPESMEMLVGFSEAIQRFNDEGGSYGRTVTLGAGLPHLLEADTIASLLDEPLGQAVRNQILDRMVADGITSTALIDGPPDSELSHKLSIAGIEYDEVAATMLVTDRRAIDQADIESWLEQIKLVRGVAMASSAAPTRIYAPVSAIAPWLESINEKRLEYVLVDLDESSIRWALSKNQSADAAAGFAMGTLLGEALLLTGRDPTRHGVAEAVRSIDLQSRLFTWRSGTDLGN